MLKYARLLIALSALGFVTAANAQLTPDYDTPAYVSNGGPFSSLHGWHINGGMLFNKFSNNGTEYVTQQLINPNASLVVNNIFSLNTQNHLGYMAGIGYFYDGLDSEIDLSYSQLNSSDTSTVHGANLFSLVDSPVGLSAWETGRNSYASMSLTGGHLVRFSPFFDFYYYGGLNYTHLSRNFDVFVPVTGLINFPGAFGTSFNGFGPTFGLNGSIHPFYFCDWTNFTLSGELQASFLYGTVTSYARNRFQEIGDPELRTLIRYAPVKGIVPAFTGKLALNYIIPMPIASLMITGGYQAIDLLKVTKDSQDFLSNLSNAALYGFYLNFTAVF